MAGLATGMLVSLTGTFNLFPAPLESAMVFIFGATVFASFAPRRQMRQLENDDHRDAVSSLAQRAAALAAGDRTTPVHAVIMQRDDDIGTLSRAIHDLAGQAITNKQQARLMSRRIGSHVKRETVRATLHLQKAAMTDPLTGLGNRRSLEWHANHLMATDGADTPLSVLLLDMDRFKVINDTLGHIVGDRCLRFLADVCRAALRKRDVVARLGGDEFIVIMPGASPESARLAAQRVAGLFGQMPWSHALPRPTLSIGLAGGRIGDLAPGGGLLERADAALYDAKKLGRAQLAVARPDADAA